LKKKGGWPRTFWSIRYFGWKVHWGEKVRRKRTAAHLLDHTRKIPSKERVDSKVIRSEGGSGHGEEGEDLLRTTDAWEKGDGSINERRIVKLKGDLRE